MKINQIISMYFALLIVACGGAQSEMRECADFESVGSGGYTSEATSVGGAGSNGGSTSSTSDEVDVSSETCIPEIVTSASSATLGINLAQGVRTAVYVVTLEHASPECHRNVTMSDLNFVIMNGENCYWCRTSQPNGCNGPSLSDDGWNFSEALLMLSGEVDALLPTRVGFKQLSSINSLRLIFDREFVLLPGETQQLTLFLTVAPTDQAVSDLGSRFYDIQLEKMKAVLPTGDLVAVQDLPSNKGLFAVLCPSGFQCNSPNAL